MTNSKKSKGGRPKGSERMKLVGIRLPAVLLERVRSLAAEECLPYQTYLRKLVWDSVLKKATEVPQVKN